MSVIGSIIILQKYEIKNNNTKDITQSELPKMSNIKHLFRWIVVIPGGLIAGILATFPLHWIIYLKSKLGYDSFLDLPTDIWADIERILSPFVISLVFVWVGSVIAPKHRRITAVALAIIYVLAMILALIITNNAPSFSSLGGVLGVLLGACVGLFSNKGNNLYTINK